MQSTKRLLAGVLSLALVCSMGLMPVSAAEGDASPEVNPYDSGTETSSPLQRAPLEGTVTYPVLPAGTFEELYGKLPEAPANRSGARAAIQNIYRADYYGAQLAQIYGNSYSTDGYKALANNHSTPNANDTVIRYTTPFEATSEAVVDKYVMETLGGYVPYVADVPSFFWDNGSISLEGFEYYLGDTIESVKLLTGKWITNNNDYNSVQAAQGDVSSLNAEVADIISGIPAGASDYEKLAYFNQELASRITYDDDLANGMTVSRRGYNATGALLDDLAVCDGYAKAFKMLCDEVGIPCLRISGTGVTPGGSGNHAWNYVQLKGSWYAVDTTWNDPTIVDESNNPVDNSAYWWDYFLVGSNTKDYSGANFIDSHLPNVLEDFSGQMVTDPYQVPTLSKSAYKPTADEATTYQITTTKTGDGVFLPNNPTVVALQSQKITMQANPGSFVYSVYVDTDPIPFVPYTFSDSMSYSYSFINVQGYHTLRANFRTVEDNKKYAVNARVTGGIGTINAGTFIPEGIDTGILIVYPATGYEVDSMVATSFVNGQLVDIPLSSFNHYSNVFEYDAVGDTTIEVSFKESGTSPENPSYTSPVYTASDDTTVQLIIPAANGNLNAAISLAATSGTPESALAQQKADGNEILTGYRIDLSDNDGNPVHYLENDITVKLEGLNLEAGTQYTVIGVHENGKVTLHSATVKQLSTGLLTFKSNDFSSFYVVKGKLYNPLSISGVSVASKVYDGTAVTYTGTPVASDGSTSIAVPGFDYVWSTASGAALPGAPKAVGDYKLTISAQMDHPPYVGSVEIPFTIDKAALTVKAEDKTVSTGGAMPVLTYTATGLVDGDSFTTAPTLTTTATDTNTVGEYPISVSGGVLTNADSYSITYASGKLTISGGGGGSGGSGSSGGGSSSGGSSVIVTPPTAENPNAPINAKVEIPAKMDANGNANVTISTKSITDAIQAAQDAAKKNDTPQNGISITINANGAEKASGISVDLNASALKALTDAGVKALTIECAPLTVALDLDALNTLLTAGGDVKLSATKQDSAKLSAEAQKAVGNRPVYQLTAAAGGKAISQFGGQISVAIPYIPAAGEASGNLCGVYVDDNGKVTWLTDSSYDSNAKMLRFTTEHFSVFGIGYREDAPMFTDIGSHWAKDDIAFVVSRGMLNGTGATTFSPDGSMTRGMFVTALGRLAAADVSGYTQSSFGDVTAGSYYLGYIEWANKNSIVAGVGGGKFAPDQSITREQMAVILANYAKAMRITLPQTHAEVSFADEGTIAAYAKDAVRQMQLAGILNGKTGNSFDPQGTATRAEVSAMLRRFVQLAVPGDAAA